MIQMHPVRRALALFALALGGFGIGSTEFVTMGLLPLIAEDLVPGFDANREQAIATAGVLISLYALGVVVGAPLTAIFTARVSQSKLSVVLLAAFVLGTIATAVMPGFVGVGISRFLAALPHGAYFGVASLLAARLMGPDKQGAGVALALSGLTVANVVGVPAGTWLGQAAGWRWAYVAVAAIFLLAFGLAWLTLPRLAGNPERSALKELAAFRSRRLWLMIVVAAIGFGGFFAVYSYIADVTTLAAGLPEHAVPWVLSTLGVGMTLGNIAGGVFSDRNLRLTIVVGFSSLIASLVIFATFAWHPVVLFLACFLVGATSSLLVPSIQTRIIALAGEADLLGAAVNHAAFNIGNSLGAASGGIVIAIGLGYLAPGWVGAAMAAAGFLLLLVSLSSDRRPATEHHPLTEPASRPRTK